MIEIELTEEEAQAIYEALDAFVLSNTVFKPNAHTVSAIGKLSFEIDAIKHAHPE